MARVVMITGASRGIGARIAERFASRGDRVALVARTHGPLEAIADRLGGVAFPADLADPDALAPLVDAVTGRLGRVDVLVNNAGVEDFQHYRSADPAAMARAIQINLTSALVLTRLVLPAMLDRRSGHVVFMASTAGLAGTPYGAVYAATKSGLIAASMSLRVEHHGTGVGFSAVCPGFVAGDGMHEVHVREVGEAPWVLGGTTLDAVANAVLRCVDDDLPDVIVNSRPFRPALALGRLFPRVGAWSLRQMAAGYMKKLADARA